MDFSALKTALTGRGFNDLSTTDQGTYINNARAELDRSFLWPWREAAVTGAPPLTIADLDAFEAVVLDSTHERLEHVDWQVLLATSGDLSIQGEPWAYYRAYVSGSPVIATYPDTTATITAQYWKVTADLVNTTDEPDSPDQVHPLIVEIAVRNRRNDVADYEGAAAAAQQVDRMTRAFLQTYRPGAAEVPLVVPIPVAG